MALPPSGAISTDQIMNELGIAVQPREWGGLWALAVPGSTPKNKANSGGPYVLPNDWWGYVHSTSFAHLTVLTPCGLSGEACDISHDFQNLYSDDQLMEIGTFLYTDPALTIPFTSFSYFFRYIDGRILRIDAFGMVNAIVNCSGFPANNAWFFGIYGYADDSAPCSDTDGNEQFKYSSSTFLSVNDFLYNNADLTSPFNGNNFWWKFQHQTLGLVAMRVSTIGQVLSMTSCS